MSRIALRVADLEAIRRHGAETYPEECCGFLLGRVEGEATLVERLSPVVNEREDSRGNRYLIRPETVLSAHREARRQGIDVVGYYHSHPDHPAVPSDFDRDHAWPGLSYVIVAVAGGIPRELRSWRLDDDRTRFQEEEVSGGTATPAKEAVG